MTLHTATAVVTALFLAACVFGHTVSLRMIFLGSALVGCVALAVRDRPLRALPPPWLAFALWGAWSAVTTAWSSDPEWSRKEWRNEVLYAGAALWTCYIAAHAPNAGRIFAGILAAAAVLAAGLAVRDFSQGLLAYQAGWHGGPGNHSSMLLVLMPCVAAAAWYAHRAGWPLRRAAPLWGLAVVLLVSAYTTLNRTLWLAFAVQFAMLGAFALLRNPLVMRGTRARMIAAGIGLAVVVGCSAVLVHVQAERELVGSQTLEKDPRLELWPEILRYVELRPWSGYGFGRRALRPELQQKFSHFDPNLWHAHNLFLEALVQTGFPGLLLLVILLGVVGREGWRAARDPDDLRAACGIMLLGVLAGMLVRNMTDTLFVRQNALLFWGVAGVLLALGDRRRVLGDPAA